MVASVANGRGQMPAFKKKLSKQEIAAAVAYVRTVERLCLDAGARTVRVAQNEAERARLWQGRKKAFGAMGRVASHLVVQDAVVPRTRLPDDSHVHGDDGVPVGRILHALAADALDLDAVGARHGRVAFQACECE